MAPISAPGGDRQLWRLVERQHGVIARRQLLEAGLTADAIKHRLRRGKLQPIHWGVYAVGRPQLSRRGEWMAAVLACSPDAVVSHGTAAALWGIEREGPRIETSVGRSRSGRRPGIVVHRALHLSPADRATRHGIPVTTPVRTLVDLGKRLSPRRLEAAVNAADKLELVDPETLRMELDRRAGQLGVRALRELLDRRTFALTDSELERRFLRLARQARLPPPETGVRLNGFKVDFFWPQLGLVVETDGLRYHRTAAQQARDRRRDQAHTAAGLTTLRFTHSQVTFEVGEVAATLAKVADRLAQSG